MNRYVHLVLALGAVGLLAALLLALAAGPQPAAHADGDIIKVPDDHPTIQEAIDAAADGDTILVAAGTYTENLSISEGITLTGGWDPTFASRTPGDSVIDGSYQGRVISITCASSDTVVTIDGFTIQNGDASGLAAPAIPALPGSGSRSHLYLDGVLPARARYGTPDPAMAPSAEAADLRAHLAGVAARGLYPGGPAAHQAMLERLEQRTAQAEEAQARAQAPPAPPQRQPQQGAGAGGGVYSWKASLHLLNCGIYGNVATQSGTGWGGGVYASYAAPSGTLIANNDIRANTASGDGQGVGGGLALFVTPGAVIEGNRLAENWASTQGAGQGGGAYLYASPSVILQDNGFWLNVGTAYGEGQGGGLCVYQSMGTRVAGNRFASNVASSYGEGYGGGLHLFDAPGAIVAGNEIVDNAGLDAGIVGSSNGGGGGLMVDSSPNVEVRDNLVEGNTGNAAWEAHAGTGGGLQLFMSDGAVVTGNRIRANLAVLNGGGAAGGLMVQHATGTLVTGNEVRGNWGVMFAPMSPGSSGGGGIALVRVTGSTVSGNKIWENTGIVYRGSDCYGGGFFASAVSQGTQLSDNDIRDNVACLHNEQGISGGGGGYIGDSEGTVLAGNIIAGNVAGLGPTTSRGGGLFLRNTVGSQLLHNHFEGNVAGTEGYAFGGGLAMDSFFGWSRFAYLDGNLFLNNQASADPDAHSSAGGACYAWMVRDGFEFTNNVVAGNRASEAGGLWMRSAEHARVANNTLVHNTGAALSASVVTTHTTDVDFVNNIVVSHTVGISVGLYTTLTAGYNLWDAVTTEVTGTGTISHTHPVYGDPAFAGPASDDYHLSPGSAAINAGDLAGVPPAPPQDGDGVARPVGTAVDLGAYEWQGHWQYLPFAARNWQAHTGWAAGDAVDGYGTIIHTADGGQTWARQGSAGEIPDVHLGGTAAIDDLNAWVVGDQGTILRTRDGGRTWERQEVPAEASGAGLCGIYAVDGNTAWVGGARSDGEPSVILHTTDGGQTWTKQGQDLALNAWLCGVYASDAEHAWLVGDKEPGNDFATIVGTSDGGATWERLPCPPQRAGLNPALISIHGVDANTLWAVGNAQALLSEDGGNTWVNRPPPSGFLDVNGVAALDRDSVWVVVDNGGIFRSEDRGQSWAKQAIPDGLGGDYVLRISAVDSQTAWAVTGPDPRYPSAPGHVLHTADGGQTWIAQETPVAPGFWGVSFVR